jgi:hypothetical protein
MAIKYQWYDKNQTVILLLPEKNWTWDDYLNIQQSLFAMIDSTDGIVHYLLDIQQSRGLPLGALNKLPVIFSQKHSRRGKTVVVGANSAIRNLWKLLQNVVPQSREPRYFFFDDMEEAEKLLHSEGQASLAKAADKDENQEV